jgi:hypothetical protein
MSLSTLATADPLMKDVYSPYLENQIKQADPVMALFSDGAGSAEWDGKGRQFLIGTILSLANSNMAIGMGSNLPESGVPKGGTFKVKLKHIHDSISLDAQSLYLTEGNKNSFQSELSLQMESVTEGLIKTVQRAAYGNERGAYAQVSAAVAIGATVIPVDNAGMFVNAVGGAKFISPGMVFAVLDPADAVLVTTFTVLSVAEDGLSVTTTAPTTVAIVDNSILYRAQKEGITDIATQTNKSYDFMGLDGMINDATGAPTYFGLSRTLFPNLSSKVINVGGALSDDVLQQSVDAIQARGASGSVDPSNVKILCEYGFRRAYLTLTTALRQYTGESLKTRDAGSNATTGSSNMLLGGLEILPSRNAPYGEAFFVSKSGLRKVMSKVGWLEETGSMWKQLSNAGGRLNAYVADWQYWGAWIHTRPRECVRLKGITGVSNVYYGTN